MLVVGCWLLFKIDIVTIARGSFQRGADLEQATTSVVFVCFSCCCCFKYCNSYHCKRFRKWRLRTSCCCCFCLLLLFVVVVSTIFTVTIARGSGKCRLRTSDAPCCGVKEAGSLAVQCNVTIFLWMVKYSGLNEAGCPVV